MGVGRSSSRATIRDVATAARVSPTTVSHALNGKGRIHPRTRARIQQVAERMGYQANRLAVGLRSGRSGVQALWLPLGPDATANDTLALDYYMRLASATATAVFGHGDVVMLLPPVLEGQDLTAVAVDGAIVIDPGEGDRRIEALRALEIPCVTIERNPIDPKDPWCVTSDTGHHVECLLEHLSAQGAQRIALLVPEAFGAWAEEQRAAYRSLALDHRQERLTRPVALRPAFESALRVVRAMLRWQRPPDAIVIGAERFVPGTMRALADAGRVVPNDLLVAVAVDGNYARGSNPPLTAVDLQPERQATAAAELLRNRLDGLAPSGPRTISGILQVRTSSQRPGRRQPQTGKFLGVS